MKAKLYLEIGDDTNLPTTVDELQDSTLCNQFLNDFEQVKLGFELSMSYNLMAMTLFHFLH